jgi:predicted DNA binding CopG/RHH family protein
MKKSSVHKPAQRTRISPEEALRFLEDIRTLNSDIDEPTVAISLRIPGNILRAIKGKAKADGKKYQSLIVEYLRKGLRDK